MAKLTSRSITYPIDQKIKDLSKAYVEKDMDKIKELEKYIDYFNWGIK